MLVWRRKCACWMCCCSRQLMENLWAMQTFKKKLTRSRLLVSLWFFMNLNYNFFLFSGHDTTTNAICFTLFVISRHPEVQRKLNEEIQQLIGDDDVSFKSINEFKYLDIVIKETLRLYPPAPIISRRLHEEVDFGDFIAPANANYNLVLYTMFRNSDIFENPDDFIPERFLNSDRSPYAYIPFSAVSFISSKF